MENEIVEKKPQPMTPGFGVAGQVMCGFSFMTPRLCMKQGCEFWVELNYGGTTVARCTFSWLSIILTETRAEIEKLRTNEPIKNNPDSTSK